MRINEVVHSYEIESCPELLKEEIFCCACKDQNADDSKRERVEKEFMKPVSLYSIRDDYQIKNHRDCKIEHCNDI